jgi:hypothetical protein
MTDELIRRSNESLAATVKALDRTQKALESSRELLRVRSDDTPRPASYLSGHPNPANDGHLKTGQRELIPGR